MNKCWAACLGENLEGSGCMNDGFSDQVKKALAARVGHRCSNPECRAATSGPQDDPADPEQIIREV
jgi:hypothetical protein